MAQAKWMPWWAWLWPALAWAVLAAIAVMGAGGAVAGAAGVALILCIFAAVYHAEVVAHRVGEPFGTLVLAFSVTVIEVALILFVMAGAPADKAALARDTVFAAIMIGSNGILGLCLLVGGMHHHEQEFQLHGARKILAVLAALAVLTLILPNATARTAVPAFTTPQLVFAGVVSLVLYGTYLFVQTVRHRDYFLPVGGMEEDAHAPPPPARLALLSLALLVLALIAVVVLDKALTPTLELGIAVVGAPKSTVGIIIAFLVMLPEGIAALRAARADRLQTSLNLALGSALASIGLTIPAVAVASILMRQPLELGLDAKEEVLLALTLFLGVITLGTGRTTILQGAVHLVIFLAFVFFAAVP